MRLNRESFQRLTCFGFEPISIERHRPIPDSSSELPSLHLPTTSRLVSTRTKRGFRISPPSSLPGEDPSPSSLRLPTRDSRNAEPRRSLPSPDYALRTPSFASSSTSTSSAFRAQWARGRSTKLGNGSSFARKLPIINSISRGFSRLRISFSWREMHVSFLRLDYGVG